MPIFHSTSYGLGRDDLLNVSINNRHAWTILLTWHWELEKYSTAYFHINSGSVINHLLQALFFPNFRSCLVIYGYTCHGNCELWLVLQPTIDFAEPDSVTTTNKRSKLNNVFLLNSGYMVPFPWINRINPLFREEYPNFDTEAIVVNVLGAVLYALALLIPVTLLVVGRTRSNSISSTSIGDPEEESERL